MPSTTPSRRAGSSCTSLAVRPLHPAPSPANLETAIDLVKNISEYTYDRRTRTFFQPQAAREILQNMLEVNPNLRKTLTGNAYKHAEQGLGEPAEAPHALEAVLVNLGQQAETPVLIAVDEVQALYSTSWYRDPYFKPIEACHLSVPRLLLDFASGRKTIVRAAPASAPPLTHLLRRRRARSSARTRPRTRTSPSRSS